MMFFAYGLYNEKRNKIYIGQTSNIERRLKRHNGELLSKRNSYTSKNDGRWVVVHKEPFDTRKKAIRREKQLKTQKGREYIWKVVKKWWRVPVG